VVHHPAPSQIRGQRSLGSRGRSEIRIIFAFDPSQSTLLLLGGDKAGNWQRWYRDNIPLAEELYLDYTAETEE
jgi:hypothetical protein